jgi:hypothetical protein
MRKFLVLALVTIGMIGSSLAQMAIPGEVFATNPARFNGRQVSVKNVQFVKTSNQNSSVVGPVAPIGHAQVMAGTGPIGSPTGPTSGPCRPPRGFTEVGVHFIGAPEYKGCFFMMDNMKAELDRQMGLENNLDAQITFRGDPRVGFHVTFYRIGR